MMDRMRSRFDVLDARLSPESASRDMDMRSMTLDDLIARARRALESQIESMRSRFMMADARISPSAAIRDLDAQDSRLESVYGRLSPQSALRDIDLRRASAESLFTVTAHASEAALKSAEGRLSQASASLESLNPTRVMERGYGIVVGPDGRAVTSVSGIIVGQRLDVRLRDGTARTSVREIREERI